MREVCVERTANGATKGVWKASESARRRGRERERSELKRGEWEREEDKGRTCTGAARHTSKATRSCSGRCSYRSRASASSGRGSVASSAPAQHHAPVSSCHCAARGRSESPLNFPYSPVSTPLKFAATSFASSAYDATTWLQSSATFLFRRRSSSDTFVSTSRSFGSSSPIFLRSSSVSVCTVRACGCG